VGGAQGRKDAVRGKKEQFLAFPTALRFNFNSNFRADTFQVSQAKNEK
jgi:hypothetical protein